MTTGFHVCDIARRSGITKYALDFHQAVLGPLGYELVRPQDLEARLFGAPADTVFHFQMGAGQFEERLVLSRVLLRGFTQVDATLHDPPFLTFPFLVFRSPFLMRLSRLFDWSLYSFGRQGRTIRKLRQVYVLSEKGAAALAGRGVRNIRTIPHIVLPEEISLNTDAPSEDLLYFGFIGKGKGLEYALALHERMLQQNADLKLHVVGEAVGNSNKVYFARLKERFSQQTIFHGYVNDERLDALFSEVRHVLLPFKPYRYFTPVSGSAINALKRGRILWTTPVNALPELIRDGENGFFLTGEIDQDIARFSSVSRQPARLKEVAEAALATATRLRDYPYRKALSRTAVDERREGPLA